MALPTFFDLIQYQNLPEAKCQDNNVRLLIYMKCLQPTILKVLLWPVHKLLGCISFTLVTNKFAATRKMTT
jgi:hypothetical protein